MKVPDSLDRQLADLATRRGVSKSSLVRQAVSELVAREGTSKTASKGSFLAAAQEHAGTIEGPEDLSTEARHLEGYGR